MDINLLILQKAEENRKKKNEIAKRMREKRGDELKEKQKESPDRVYPLTEVLKRFDKEMDSSEKELIDDILKEQKWIK